MKSMALWCVGSNQVELREGNLGDGFLVETLFSGISRGTEQLVFEGRVPVSEQERMRAPAQEGDFSFPVKFGYCAVGRVSEGEHVGRNVFALHPHQASFRLPSESFHLLPDGLPAERAVLAANMETALNVVWDSAAGPGDRIVVIGAGVLGCLIGFIASQIPGAEVTLVDINATRKAIANKLGCSFAGPSNAPTECDVVIHTSGSGEGVSLAFEIAGQEAAIVEASWFGAGSVSLPLGGAFHSRRLRLISSQVGSIPPNRAPRWNYHRRMSMALQLLRDSRLDALFSGTTNFEDIASNYEAILNDPGTLCHRIQY